MLSSLNQKIADISRELTAMKNKQSRNVSLTGSPTVINSNITFSVAPNTEEVFERKFTFTPTEPNSFAIATVKPQENVGSFGAYVCAMQRRIDGTATSQKWDFRGTVGNNDVNTINGSFKISFIVYGAGSIAVS